MTDPLDSLRRTDDTLAPDPRFRVELLDRVANALVAESTDSVAGAGAEAPRDPKEIPMLKQLTPNRTSSYVKIGLGLVAAAAVLVVGLVFIGDDDNETPVPPANSDTSLPSPGPLEEEIAAAALLSASEIGDGYQIDADQNFVFTLPRDGGPGADAPACGPYLDGVFESSTRPATIRTRAFVKLGAAMQQYVAVFADETDAVEMMTLVADEGFADCWAAVATVASVNAGIDIATAQVPVAPRTLEEAGDDMTVVELYGTFTSDDGDTSEYAGPTVFVRVGRVVTFINPNAANTILGDPGYPDEQLEQALQTIADRLEEIQAS